MIWLVSESVSRGLSCGACRRRRPRPRRAHRRSGARCPRRRSCCSRTRRARPADAQPGDDLRGRELEVLHAVGADAGARAAEAGLAMHADGAVRRARRATARAAARAAWVENASNIGDSGPASQPHWAQSPCTSRSLPSSPRTAHDQSTATSTPRPGRLCR